MARLSLALLGDFQAKLNGHQLAGLNSDRLRGLLSYLAVESRREHPRELVAALLWPERSDQEALSSLRYALSNLNHALGNRQSDPPFILTSRTHIQFNLASDHWLDMAEFQSLINQSDLSKLEQAADLYRGPFLDGLSIAESPAFDEWMLLKGEEIQRNVLALLDRLATLHLAGGDATRAARWARRQLELDPYREQAHRQLMVALTQHGERSAALAHYEACRRLLAQELSCAPEDETQELYARIREGALPQLSTTPAGLDDFLRHASAAIDTEAAPRFVARQVELAKLRGLMEKALTGQGGVALVSGEAGSGKTALLDEFSRQAGFEHSSLIALRGRCSAHGGAGDPFLPFRELLETLTGDIESKRAGGTLSPEQARRSWEALPTVSVALVEHGPDLIDRFVRGESLLRHLEGFSAHMGITRLQRQLRELLARPKEGAVAIQPDLFAQVTQVLHTLSVRNPLVLAIDDLQWADGGTAALLFHLGRHLAGSRVLILCAFRHQALVGNDGSQTDASGIANVLRELAREWGDIHIDLDQTDGQAFVRDYIDSEPNCLDEEFRRRLYHHTEGNPLFTVELLRSFERWGMLIQDESGRWTETPELDWEFCPPQVEVVIAGHLSALPDEDLSLLQAAAVQGEHFTAEVVARALDRDEGSIIQRLSGSLRKQHRLVQAVSLCRLDSTGMRLSEYRFRHTLIQRIAYASLDAVERAKLHEATGRALEAIYSGEAEQSQALALARHYEAAGLNFEAARALYEAGRQAMRLSAYREALQHIDQGLMLLEGEPLSPKRRGVEQLLNVARLALQHNLAGAGGMEMANALKRASEAGAVDAQGRPRLQMLLSEGQFLSAGGRLEESLANAQQLLDLATQWGDEVFVGTAHWRLAHILNILARLQESEEHFNWLLAWLTPEWQSELVTTVCFGMLPHVLSFSALNQWFLGYPEQALLRCNQAVMGEIEQKDLYGQAFASGIGCTVLYLLRSDGAALKERSELCYRHSQQQGYSMWQPYAEVFLGRLAVMRGEDVLGVERMQRAIAAWQALGMAIGTDSLVMVLADGCLTAARRHMKSDDAMRGYLLAAGLAAIEPILGPQAPCGQSYQAELHRLMGELLLERDGLSATDEVLACFEHSSKLGREMGALSWELRTAMSLVRLRICQGEGYIAELQEAQSRLRNIYARFTEGFAFPDLQEAADLINEADRRMMIESSSREHSHESAPQPTLPSASSRSHLDGDHNHR